MYKVINFFTNQIISTHETLEDSISWVESKGYYKAFMLRFLLIKPFEDSHKPQILKIVLN